MAVWTNLMRRIISLVSSFPSSLSAQLAHVSIVHPGMRQLIKRMDLGWALIPDKETLEAAFSSKNKISHAISMSGDLILR